jgi:hypothetical protein
MTDQWIMRNGPPAEQTERLTRPNVFRYRKVAMLYCD